MSRCRVLEDSNDHEVPMGIIIVTRLSTCLRFQERSSGLALGVPGLIYHLY